MQFLRENSFTFFSVYILTSDKIVLSLKANTNKKILLLICNGYSHDLKLAK